MRATTLVLAWLMSDAAFAQEARRDLYGDPLPKGALMRLGTLRFRHGASAIHCLAFAPDGRRLASGGDDHLIRIWDARTGSEQLRLVGHRDSILVVSFSPDGKTLVSAGRDYTVRLWDVASGRLLQTLQHTCPMPSVAFFPDGKSIVTSDAKKKRIYFWATTNGECLRKLDAGEEGARRLSVSADGKWLATRGDGSVRIRLWDVACGKPIRAFEARHSTDDPFALSPDGRMLAMGDQWKIVVWNLKTGRKIKEVAVPDAVLTIRAMLFTPDSQALLFAGDDWRINGGFYCWSMTEEKKPQQYGRALTTVSSLSLTPDGKVLAFAGLDHVIRLWDLPSGKRLIRATGHEGNFRDLHFDADGKTLFATDSGGTARTWDLKSSAQLHCFDYSEGSYSDQFKIAVSLQDRIAAVAQERSVRLQELATGKTRAIFKTTEPVQTSAFSQDGKILAIATKYDQVEVWDVLFRRRRCRVPGGLFPQLSGDGRWLVTKTDGNQLRIWDTISGQERRRIAATEECWYRLPYCFSSDNHVLLCLEWPTERNVLGKQSLTAWEVQTGQLRFRLQGAGGIKAASFSADGRLLAVGDGEGATRVLHIPTGQERACFQGGQGYVSELAFSHDDRTLACGGGDTTILFWPLPRTVSARRTRHLSAEELRSVWADLASGDGERAFQAMRTLHAAPVSTVEFLRARLQPMIRIPDSKSVQRLLADLNADSFAVREAASAKLAQHGEGIEPQLRQALLAAPSLEARTRLKRLLEPMSDNSPQRWRCARALEVLEWLDTVESRRLLEELSGGAADAWLTGEAKRARHRQHRLAEPRP
jgi:WD40 repeat protein